MELGLRAGGFHRLGVVWALERPQGVRLPAQGRFSAAESRCEQHLGQRPSLTRPGRSITGGEGSKGPGGHRSSGSRQLKLWGQTTLKEWLCHVQVCFGFGQTLKDRQRRPSLSPRPPALERRTGENAKQRDWNGGGCAGPLGRLS